MDAIERNARRRGHGHPHAARGSDEGIQVADQLRETQPETGVVVLSQFADPQYALALLEEGSARRAYLLKERVSDVE